MNFYYEHSQSFYYLGLWLAITLSLIGVPYFIRCVYRGLTFNSRTRSRERARLAVDDLTRRCAEARGNFGSDEDILRRIGEGNRIDLYSPEAVSVLGADVASDLREIKQRMDNIDKSSSQLRDFSIYNPYKGR